MSESAWSSTRRSAGVTCAAALAVLGSATGFYVWSSLFLGVLNAEPDSHGKHLYELHPIPLFFMASVPLFLIASGIRTGIGLFHLKTWARKAALLWAAVAVCFCLWMIAVRPFETFFIPEHFVSDVESFKQLLAISLIFALLPVSVWWIFFFRLPSVKRQFEEPPPESAQN
ncbi:MAG TPA: hypothetical protein VJX70_10920 [Candidatus Acidoferrum sp.]|nr:hypothetical protein [Candidatus Acidoferrum sp.]